MDINVTKLEKVLVASTKHLVADLLPWCSDAASPGQGLEAVLILLDSGEEGWWGVRARYGWWREFCRRVSRFIGMDSAIHELFLRPRRLVLMSLQFQTHLRPLAEIIGKTVFGSLPERGIADEAMVEARAEAMVRGVWRAVVGGEE